MSSLCGTETASFIHSGLDWTAPDGHWVYPVSLSTVTTPPSWRHDDHGGSLHSASSFFELET